MPVIYIGIIFLTVKIIQVSEQRFLGLSLAFTALILLKITGKLKKSFYIYIVAAAILIAPQFFVATNEDAGFFAILQAIFFLIAISIPLNSRLKINSSRLLLSQACSASHFALITLAVISIIQSLEFHLAGSHTVVDLISRLQIYPNQYIIEQFKSGYFRAIGTYFEPSFFCLVSSTLWLIIFISKKTTIYHDALLIIIAVISQSSLGLMTGALFLAFKHTDGFRLISNTKGSVILFTTFPIIIYFGGHLLSRLMELNIEGASGYYRMVAPLSLVKWVLLERITPIPLGASEKYVMGFFMMNGSQVGASLDNGYYFVLAHFSWGGLLLITLFAIYASINFYKELSKKSPKALSYIFFLIIPLYTGAIFSPEVLFIAVLLLSCIRIKSELENRNRDALNHNRNIQQSQWTQRNL